MCSGSYIIVLSVISSLSAFGGEPVPVERGDHGLDEPGLAELAAGDVHAHGDVAVDAAARAPVAQRRARLVQHEAAERPDQAARLRDRDELLGTHLGSALGPARQRLEPAEPPAGEVEDRLVEDPQLLLLDRAAQLALHLQLG